MKADPETLAAAITRFIDAVEPLKNHTRTAWGTSGRQESVAEHSWRLALLAMIIGPHLDRIDSTRLVELCLVHDLGETFEGDLSAPLQAGRPEKRSVEADAVETLSGILAEGDGDRLRGLWREYDSASTAEARAAKALDKIETILQHNRGSNPPDFDYRFNLGYGAGLADDQPLIAAIRELADARTADRAEQAALQEDAATGRPDGAESADR